MTNEELRAKALEIWRRHYRAEKRPDKDERSVMISAYWAGVLPNDANYSVAQWVEDGCPGFM